MTPPRELMCHGCLSSEEGSFSILVSKSLDPYQPSQGNKMFRIGKSYLVLEVRNNVVIAVHRAKG